MLEVEHGLRHPRAIGGGFSPTAFVLAQQELIGVASTPDGADQVSVPATPVPPLAAAPDVIPVLPSAYAPFRTYP